MIDKQKFILFNRITIIVLLIFLLLFFIRISLAFFHTDSDGKVINSIAFYAMDVSTQTKNLKMFEISPDGKDNVYEIDVLNYKDNKVSEVDIEYNLILKTTTNLPVDFKMYLNDGTNNIITSKEFIQDEDGMYFLKLNIPARNFTHGVQSMDKYKLVVNLSNAYNSEQYQGLIENVEVTLESKQV